MGQAIQGVPKAMEAERFVLRDTGGRVRAALGMEADGSVGLWLLDSAGKTRAGVGVSREGSPGVALPAQTGKPRLPLNLTDAPGLRPPDQAGARIPRRCV